jgi:hypothetical protein
MHAFERGTVLRRWRCKLSISREVGSITFGSICSLFRSSITCLSYHTYHTLTLYPFIVCLTRCADPAFAQQFGYARWYEETLHRELATASIASLAPLRRRVCWLVGEFADLLTTPQVGARLSHPLLTIINHLHISFVSLFLPFSGRFYRARVCQSSLVHHHSFRRSFRIASLHSVDTAVGRARVPRRVRLALRRTHTRQTLEKHLNIILAL